MQSLNLHYVRFPLAPSRGDPPPTLTLLLTQFGKMLTLFYVDCFLTFLPCFPYRACPQNRGSSSSCPTVWPQAAPGRVPSSCRPTSACSPTRLRSTAPSTCRHSTTSQAPACTWAWSPWTPFPRWTHSTPSPPSPYQTIAQVLF